MFIDTHCHLDIIAGFGEEKVNLTTERLKMIAQIVDQAAQAQVSTIINVGCDEHSSHNSIALARLFPRVFAVVGAHPYEGNENWKAQFNGIKALVEKRTAADKIVGIGEIGLDFSRPNSNKVAQYDLLKAQLELALKHQLPVTFHVRDAGDEFLEFLKPYHQQLNGAVVHCFQQSQPFADQVIKWGLMIGVDGPITYPKNVYLRDIVANVDLSRIVLETDAPFLPVQQERGKLNYPSKIPLIAVQIAQIKGIELHDVAKITTRNAGQLFALPVV